MKKIYHRQNAFAKEYALEVLNKSDYVIMVNTTRDFIVNLRALEDDICRQYPTGTITMGHLFTACANNSTFTAVKALAASDQEIVIDLRKGSKVCANMHNSPVPQKVA